MALSMSYPNDFPSQIARIPSRGGGRGQRGTRDFERNLRCWLQRAMHRNKCSPRRNIQGAGKFQKFLAPLVVASHKNRNG